MKATILPSLDDQAGDEVFDLIDPAGVTSPDTVPVFFHWDHSMLVGYAENVRMEDGNLVADIHLFDNTETVLDWSVGGAVRRVEENIIREFELYCVSDR